MPPMGWDYAVFVVFIVGSTIYPIWDELRGRQGGASKQNFVFAAGRVSVFAIMMSLARGTIGVRSVIGYPSELFYRGSAMFECIYGIAIAFPFVLWLFVPVYLNLEITSVYEYLDMRFHSRLVRGIASAIFMVRSLINMSMTIYTPCVALQTIVGVPFWASMLTLTGISICFTLFGGLKAAITADVIQGVTVVAVSVLVVVKGVIHSGGVENVYNINSDNGRLQFFHVGDLSTRVDTVSAVLGQAFMQLSVLGCQQNLMQRYMSLKNMRDISKTLYWNVLFITVLYALPWIVGMVVYAAYALCDPRKMGFIAKPDEILPFFVFDKLLVIPGCVGLFLATLLNGALCIYVSNVNSLATVLWEDFISQIPRFRDCADRNQLYAIKCFAVVFALIAFGGAFVVGMLTGVVEFAQMTSSATTGPLVGVFLLAMFVPRANWKGATAGMVVTLVLTVVWWTGYQMDDRRVAEPFMDTSVEGCTNDTFSPWIEAPHRRLESESFTLLQTDAPTHARLRRDADGPEMVGRSPFALSYMYYGMFGTILTMVLGTVVSCWTASDADVCDERLLNPYFVRAMKWYRGNGGAGGASTAAAAGDRKMSIQTVSMSTEKMGSKIELHPV